MHLDEFLEAVKAAPDMALENLGIKDNYAVYLQEHADVVRRGLAEAARLTIDGEYIHGRATQSSFRVIDRLVPPWKGLSDDDEQRLKGYYTTLIVRKNPLHRTIGEDKLSAMRAIADGVQTVGEYVKASELLACFLRTNQGMLFYEP